MTNQKNQKIKTPNGIEIKTTQPFRFLAERIGKSIRIVTDAYIYKGILETFDSYLNIVLTEATIINRRNFEEESQDREVFVRGGAIISIT